MSTITSPVYSNLKLKPFKLYVNKGYDFQCLVTFPFLINGCTFSGNITNNSNVVVVDFTILPNTVDRTISITLTKTQTDLLEHGNAYNFQVKMIDSTAFESKQLIGTIVLS